MRKFYWTLLLVAFYSGPLHAADLKVGDPAPAFNTTDESGKPVALQDFKGKSVILYFYPKDDTPGCTAQAQGFRDHYAEFNKLGTVVLGISFDSSDSHQRFKEKHQLPFPLLLDPERKIAQAYGVKGDFFPSRDVIIIDAQGKILKILRAVDPRTVVELLLKETK